MLLTVDGVNVQEHGLTDLRRLIEASHLPLEVRGHSCSRSLTDFLNDRPDCSQVQFAREVEVEQLPFRQKSARVIFGAAMRVALLLAKLRYAPSVSAL